MNREDTIKDIAQYVCGACELDMTCKRDYGEFTYTCCDNALSPAVKIYEAGYRKTFTSDTQKAFKDGYKKGCETCAQAWANGYNYGYKSGKEDGVKEFAEKAKEQSETFLSGLGNGICVEKDYVSVEYIDNLLEEYMDTEGLKNKIEKK